MKGYLWLAEAFKYKFNKLLIQPKSRQHNHALRY
jgi:hypothetical protein